MAAATNHPLLSRHWTIRWRSAEGCQGHRGSPLVGGRGQLGKGKNEVPACGDWKGVEVTGSAWENGKYNVTPPPSPLQYNRAIIWRKRVITTTEGTIMKLCFWSLGWSSFSWLPFFIDFFYVNEVRQWNFLVNYNKCAIFHWFCAKIGVCHISFKVCHFSLIFGHFILILCHHLIGDSQKCPFFVTLPYVGIVHSL